MSMQSYRDKRKAITETTKQWRSHAITQRHKEVKHTSKEAEPGPMHLH